MSDRRSLLYKEWFTFAVLLAVLSVVFTLLPLPQGGRSEMIREQMYLLPIIAQPLDVASVQTELSSDNLETTVATEVVLSNEEISGLLLEAFNIQEDVETTNLTENFSSRSPGALSVDDIDLSQLGGVPAEGAPVDMQQNTLDLRGNTSSTRRLVPNLTRPSLDVDTRYEESPRAFDTDPTTYTTPDLEVREEVRPLPVTAEDFNEVAFEDSLAIWILNNPADLDPVVLSLMGNNEEVKTARSRGQAGTSSYELQLMLTPGNGEVRIVLIEGLDLYYFVRPRTRRRASYFQKGFVRRDATSSVIAVESEDFSPEGTEAQTFYGLFLDWWRIQKK